MVKYFDIWFVNVDKFSVDCVRLICFKTRLTYRFFVVAFAVWVEVLFKCDDCFEKMVNVLNKCMW